MDDRTAALEDRHRACDCGVRCWTADDSPRRCQCTCGGKYHGAWGDFHDAAVRLDRARVPQVPASREGLAELLTFRRDVEVVKYATDEKEAEAAAYLGRGLDVSGVTSPMREVRPKCDRLLADVDHEIERVETKLAEWEELADLSDEELDAELGIQDLDAAERELARDEFRDRVDDSARRERASRNRKPARASRATRVVAPPRPSRADRRAQEHAARDEVRARARAKRLSPPTVQSASDAATRRELERLAAERRADQARSFAAYRARKQTPTTANAASTEAPAATTPAPPETSQADTAGVSRPSRPRGQAAGGVRRAVRAVGARTAGSGAAKPPRRAAATASETPRPPESDGRAPASQPRSEPLQARGAGNPTGPLRTGGQRSTPPVAPVKPVARAGSARAAAMATNRHAPNPTPTPPTTAAAPSPPGVQQQRHTVRTAIRDTTHAAVADATANRTEVDVAYDSVDELAVFAAATAYHWTRHAAHTIKTAAVTGVWLAADWIADTWRRWREPDWTDNTIVDVEPAAIEPTTGASRATQLFYRDIGLTGPDRELERERVS